MKIFCTYFTPLILCCFSVLVKAQTKLINPDISNSFIEDYVLADGTIRFIGSEQGRNRELFFVDRLTDGSITEPVFFPESIGNLEFNFAGVDCKVLQLKSGDVLLGINQGDCDYAPYSSLARFNTEGEVIWAISMEYFSFYYSIHKLTLVDSNIICLISDELDSLYFDTDGNEVEDIHQYQVYDTVISAQSRYYAALNDMLFHLDDEFNVVDSVLLDDEILTFSPSGDSIVVVSTLSSLAILDNNLEAVVHSASFANFDLVTASVHWIWIGQENGDIIQLDYQLQPQDTFQMPAGIKLKSMVAINENITLGGNHIGTIASSVFFHTSEAKRFRFAIRKDITLESVSLDEPIFYDFEPFGYPWGFNIRYKNLVINVTNTGYDSIQTLTIRYKEGSGCQMCEFENSQWAFDSLNLYPGAQKEFALGDFSAWCVVRTPSKFCLSILPADSLPETNNANNRLCVDVDAFLTGVNEVESRMWKLSPIPADDFITVETETGVLSGQHRIQISDMYGRLRINQSIGEPSNTIDIQDLTSGLFSVLILNASGQVSAYKLVVAHKR